MMPAHQRPMKQCFVVGGVASFVTETAARKLARWGFVVTAHHEMGKKAPTGIPAEAEAVIVFYDMAGPRQIADAVRNLAAGVSLPCLMLPRKESMWPAEMRRHGYEPINPNTAAAVAEDEEQPMTPIKPTPEKQAQVVPLETKQPARSDFATRKEQLKTLLREMVKHDGLKEVMFSPEAGLSTKRVHIEEITEDL